MRIRRILLSLAATALAASGAVLVTSTPAFAHHPEIEAQTSRPCGDDAPWSVTFEAQADADRNKEWRNRYQDTYEQTAWTDWSDWGPDDQPYGPFTISGIPASVLSVTVTVGSQWRDLGDVYPEHSGERNVVAGRPSSTTCPSTPASTPSTSTVTTPPTETPVTSPPTETPVTSPPTETSVLSTSSVTVPPTTSTTSEVCQWDPQLPDDSPECVPDLAIEAICHEIDDRGQGDLYRYAVTSNEDSDVTVAVNGVNTVLVPGENLIESQTEVLVITWNGKVAAATDANAEICTREVEVTKEITGVQPGDTLFTIRISRIVIDGEGEDDTAFVPVQEFDLLAGGSTVVDLPVGPSYLIEEIAPEGDFRPTITIDGASTDVLVLDEFRGERISVVVTNHYASVEIDKQASATEVEVGDPISYDLVVTNSGALPLSPVVVDDILPLGVGVVGWSVAGAPADLTCEVTDGAPDYVLCTYSGILEPGEVLPTITLDAVIEEGAAGTSIVNESRVRGRYDGGETEAETTLPPALRGAGPALGAPAALLAAVEVPTILACTPVAGEVCNLSPRAASTVAPVSTPSSSPSVQSSSQGTGPVTVTSAGLTTVTTPGRTTPLATTGSGPVVPLILMGGLALLVGGTAVTFARRQKIGAHRAH